MLDFLLNYVTLAIAIIAFAAGILILILGRRKLSRPVKLLLIILLVVLALYLAFILWLVIGMGSNHAPPGVSGPYMPVQTSARRFPAGFFYAPAPVPTGNLPRTGLY